jgi:hypothetical protein
MTHVRRRISSSRAARAAGPLLAAAVCAAAVGSGVLPAGTAAAPRPKAPRIVAAALEDLDRDARADRVQLTYSARIRHAADRDGRYPFTVAGYRIRWVAAAQGKSLVLVLAEKVKPDPVARPSVRYRRTTAGSVHGVNRLQAVGQLFRAARPHGHVPPKTAAPSPTPPQTTPTPTVPPGDPDSDGDHTTDAKDCAPKDASIHPGADDLPDLSFVDANCDGIDGTEEDAIFASPAGNDVNPGTRAKPKRQIQAAIATVAAGNGRYVLAAEGTYTRVDLATGVAIYGGYDATTWRRSTNAATLVQDTPYAVRAKAVMGVVLQLLTLRGVSAQGSKNAYGIRASDGSKLTLERVTVTPGAGAPGATGSIGARGLAGGNGGDGKPGYCDIDPHLSLAGAAGSSPVSRPGGAGGDGGYGDTHGNAGAHGSGGALGGAGGGAGKPGAAGESGENGTPGTNGTGGAAEAVTLVGGWAGHSGHAGTAGTPGDGGGGGGGGGGQGGAFVIDGKGSGGGGGGGGGAGGRPGDPGTWGGGSFGIYLENSAVVIRKSTVTAGAGGAGGDGGPGGFGGAGGAGGNGGASKCTDEIGAGGAGGHGGAGGRGGGGGGGAGGPSVGIMKVGTSTASISESTVKAGVAGAGGAGGGGGLGGGTSGEPGTAFAVSP